uniref:RING-type domain-containing protein n=1 Tax=Knipowitschia caucasica TaxID=637954 RepID=A0AAV2KXD6_KNICA
MQGKFTLFQKNNYKGSGGISEREKVEMVTVVPFQRCWTKLRRGNKYTTVSLSEDQAAAVKAAFSCVICRDPMKDPMFASCCTTVLGCRACLDQWQDGHAHCPKCRTDDFSFHIQSVVGLDDALTALHNIIS